MTLLILLIYSEISSNASWVAAKRFEAQWLLKKFLKGELLYVLPQQWPTHRPFGFALSLIFLSSSFLLDPLLSERIPVWCVFMNSFWVLCTLFLWISLGLPYDIALNLQEFIFVLIFCIIQYHAFWSMTIAFNSLTSFTLLIMTQFGMFPCGEEGVGKNPFLTYSLTF